MRNNLEKYDKLITAFLVIIAFILGIGWWFAEEKSEPVYLSKIDRLMFDKDNKAPKFVLTLPDKITAQEKSQLAEVVIDAVAAQKEEDAPQVVDNSFSVDKLLTEVPTVFNLKATTPMYQLKNIEAVAELVETTPEEKKLPKVSEDGRRPWIEYGHSVKVQPNFKKIALVISGLGFDLNTIEKVAEGFDAETSLGFTPYITKSSEAVSKSRTHGHETYIDLLLSSKDFFKEDKGPLSITLNLSREEALDRFRQTISAVSPIGGIIIRDGLADDSNKMVMEAILSESKSRGLLVVDATEGDSIAKINIEGLPRRRADIIINKDIGKEDIENILKKAENIAFDKGQVLIIADPKPVTIIALYNWIKTFSPQVSYEEAKTVDITKPFALVPLSNLVVE